jgi:hypothetical protein
MLNSILVILCLIAVSAFFSISEISLAASRKIKLKLLADEGNINAQRVLKMQENPGMFFTVVQIGLNAVAILGGIVGDAAFSPAFYTLFSKYFSPELAEQLSDFPEPEYWPHSRGHFPAQRPHFVASADGRYDEWPNLLSLLRTRLRSRQRVQ